MDNLIILHFNLTAMSSQLLERPCNMEGYRSHDGRDQFNVASTLDTVGPQGSVSVMYCSIQPVYITLKPPHIPQNAIQISVSKHEYITLGPPSCKSMKYLANRWDSSTPRFSLPTHYLGIPMVCSLTNSQFTPVFFSQTQGFNFVQ